MTSYIKKFGYGIAGSMIGPHLFYITYSLLSALLGLFGLNIWPRGGSQLVLIYGLYFGAPFGTICGFYRFDKKYSYKKYDFNLLSIKCILGYTVGLLASYFLFKLLWSYKFTLVYILIILYVFIPLVCFVGYHSIKAQSTSG
jgi:hypothetical protein